ncbi:MAG: VCBS repeat-containing protein [Deltaproteobacteria bacterium]|nr:VCBS repeat-containing protein [Deltaproteobacteria bacterium]
MRPAPPPGALPRDAVDQVRRVAVHGAPFLGYVHGIGDVNGDGLADVVAGASANAEVWLGNRDSVLSETAVLLTQPAIMADQLLGDHAATPGDLNGDGFTDLALGITNTRPLGPDVHGGRVFVYLGSERGPPRSPSFTLEPPTGEGADFGFDLTCSSDMNGDGLDDLVVGFPSGGYRSEGPIYGGTLLIYHGSSAGIPGTANVRIRNNLANEFEGLGGRIAGLFFGGSGMLLSADFPG